MPRFYNICSTNPLSRGEKLVKNTTCRDLLTNEGYVCRAMKRALDVENGSIPIAHPSLDKSSAGGTRVHEVKSDH